MQMRRMGAVGCAALAMTSACSIVAVRPAGWIDRKTGKTECNSIAAPTADGIAAVVLALGGVALNGFGRAVSGCGSRGDCSPDFPAYIPALIAAGSSIYGYWGVVHCNGLLERAAGQLKQAPGRLPEAASPR